MYRILISQFLFMLICYPSGWESKEELQKAGYVSKKKIRSPLMTVAVPCSAD